MNMALPLSSPDSPVDKDMEGSSIGLKILEGRIPIERSMGELRMSESASMNSHVEESPIMSHLRRKSGGGPNMQLHSPSPEKIIYLSESAEAAAESAKAKRRLLKDVSKNDQSHMYDAEMDTEAYNHEPQCRSDVNTHDLQQNRLKRSSLKPCPDPSVHLNRSFRNERPTSMASNNVSEPEHDFALGQIYPPFITARATATGSPMPFPRQRLRPPTAQSDPYAGHSDPMRHFQRVDAAHGYVNPDLYNIPRSSMPFNQPGYAFSTAASKIHGSNQAPDHRIRDSYKTDTLTALARPPSRYRKNGIGADIFPRGVGRYYQRPPSSMRPSSAKSRPSSRRTYHGESDIRFRSSPPRAPGSEPLMPLNRKRAMDDSFLATDGQVQPGRWNNTSSNQGSNEIMQLDDETSAAVRMSIFGSSTPEALHQARRGLQELSPNVQVYRKGRQENTHLRKKRRPSYWDNDLKEIRESPAGRGGVNSPVSAQASMRADFEIASQRDIDMDVDEQEDVIEGDRINSQPRSTIT